MTAEEIKATRGRVPFKPFFVELSSGRIIPIETHDHLLFTPKDKYLVICNGTVSIVEPESVVSLIVP